MLAARPPGPSNERVCVWGDVCPLCVQACGELLRVPIRIQNYASGLLATQGGASAGGFKWLHKRRRMVLPLAADKVVFKGKPKKGGADEGTAAASAGGVCV